MKTIFKKFRNMKYRWKVFLAMMMVSILPLSLSGLVFSKASKEFLSEKMRISKQTQLNQVKQTIEGKMQVYEHINDYLLSMKEMQEVLSLREDQLYELYRGYQDVVDPMLETNMYYHPVIERMTIYPKEINLEHGATIAPFEKLEERIWYQSAFPDGEAYEKWIVRVDSHTVYYVRPVNRYGKQHAVLVTKFNYDKFLEDLDTLLTYDDEVICLLAEDGTILYSSQEKVLGSNYAECLDGDYAYQEVELEALECRLLCAFPRSVIDDSMNVALRKNTILQIICLIYAIVLSYLLARWIVWRIVKLNGIVRKIGERYEDENGEHLAELKRYNGPEDEIGTLIIDISGMVERLNELKITIYKEKIARRDLEMKALQAQINPHFLYNSLSIINWKAIEAQADEVSSITLKLAEFYRTTLNRGSSIIQVEGEIRNIRSYLDIQLVMHDDNFTVHWDIAESVLNWRMPKLVLQPLVENALEHGLDLKEEDDRQLWITVWTDGEDLMLIIRDNGVGMTQEKANSLIHYDSKGYGVKNVKERIELLYGESHAFHITSSEGEGTEVFIRIPGERSEPL